MSEYMVEVGLNLNADNYVTTMGQAVNLTKQYSEVASGIPGAVQGLSKSMVNATMAVTGFNKSNSVGVDTAASYEKQLSNIEAKTKVMGGSFEKLSKTTKSFARDFPIGMGQATQVMETLQKQGIKSEMQMASLGKSFIKLGAATGTSSAAMGAEFLQLSKTMGNGISQFEKLSDSLVYTTAKIGGSAPAVVAFSKALAPVASTVGLSQTAVMGLSTAMSKLGEDGGFAANSLNKVLLDMNRAVRDGGPELKAYADLMGTTGEKLTGLFKSNPAEVLAKFSEAVAKEGPNISRSLEALGFDSVRTTRSLTALARGGGPRQAINTAMEGYGSGATDKAATAAMDGVSDEAEKLRETMSQVVQDVGQPLLGLAKTQLGMANSVAKFVQGGTSSDVGQAALGTAGAGSLALGVLGNVVTVATVASLGKMGLNALKNSSFAKQYADGRAQASYGGAAPEGGGMARAAGFARGAAMGGLMGPTSLAQGGGAAGGLGRFANRALGFAAEGTARYQAVTANQLMNLPGAGFGSRTGITPERTALLGEMKDSIKALGTSAKDLSPSAMGRAGGSLLQQLGAYGRTADVGAGRGLGNLATQSGVLAARAVSGTVGMGAKGLAMGASALGSMGLNPAMLGIGAGVVGGMMLSQSQQEGDANRDRLFESRGDVYAAFNNFAEATGNAGKGVVAFAEDMKVTTQILVEGNQSWKDAFTVSSQELAQATAPGYTQGFTLFGDDKSPEAIINQIKTVFGGDASMSDIAQVMIDVAAITNGNTFAIKEVGDQLQTSFGPDAKMGSSFDPQQLVDALGTQSDAGPSVKMNDAQTEIAMRAVGSIGREGAEAADRYTGTIKYEGGELGAARVTQLVRGRELALAMEETPLTAGDKISREAAFGLGGQTSRQKGMQSTLAAALGLDPDGQKDFGLGIGLFDNQFLGAGETGLDYRLNMDNETSRRMKAEYAAIDAAGVTVKDGVINYGPKLASGKSIQQTDSEMYLKSVGSAAGATEDFGKALTSLTGVIYSVENATLKGKQQSSLTASDVASTGGQYSLVDFANNSNDMQKRQVAIEDLLDTVVADTKGNFGQARYGLELAGAQAPTFAAQSVIAGALEQLGVRQGVAQAGRTQISQMASAVQLGQQAAQAPSNSNTTAINVQQVMEGELSRGALLDTTAQMNRSYGAMQGNIRSLNRSSGISAGFTAQQGAIAVGRAQEDYQLQRRYGRQDYATTRKRADQDFATTKSRANRDFGTSQQYAAEDFETTKSRADRDFMKQQTYAEQDFATSMTRANEDYQKGRLRAQRDYDTQINRATRDFQKGQTRGEEDFGKAQLRATVDYNKSRTRMMEDYNKQVKRMVEDSAKSMYDPFKRIQAQMVMDAGQLVTNLNDQIDQLQKQQENLAKARDMGLSEDSIKALSLADTSNAQQLARLVGDMGGNEDLVGAINTAVTAKASEAEKLMKDQGNVGYSRMAEDFATQMARGEEDFAMAQARSGEDFALMQARSRDDFATSMSDSDVDFAKSMSDMEVDFNTSMSRSDEDFKRSMTRSLDGFNTSMADMTADYNKSRDRSMAEFNKQMDDMNADYTKQMIRMEEDFQKQETRASAAIKKAIARMKADTALQIAQIGAQAGAAIQSMREQYAQLFQSSPEGVGAAKQFIENVDEMIKSGISWDSMGEDVKTLYQNAKAEIEKAIAVEQAYDSHPTDSKSPKKQIEAYDSGRNPAAAAAKEAQGFDWSATFQVIKNNMGKAMDWASVGSNWGKLLGQGINSVIAFVTALPGKIVAAWDSAVAGIDVGTTWITNAFATSFDWFAKLPETISTWIGNSWDSLTVDVPSVDVLVAVTGAFSAAQTWLENLKSNILLWVKDAWKGLTAEVPGLKDIENKVVEAFESAKTWISGLGGDGANSVEQWIGKAWDKLWKTLPTATDMFDKVKEIFTGAGDTVEGWITGLSTWIGTKMPTVSAFAEAFAPLNQGFSNVMHSIVEMWNSLDFELDFTTPKIDIPGFNIAGFSIPLPGGKSVDFAGFKWDGVSVGGTPVKSGDLIPDIAKNPFTKYADGGIAYGAHKAWIGEAGYPEAVIPLNARGAEVLAATMARYVDKSDIQASGMERYASPVTNYYTNNQDYSTQFNGQITVQAQNPDELAARLSARARRQALAQPIRGQR